MQQRPEATKFAGENGAWGAEQMQAYQDAMAQHQRITSFQDGIRRTVNEPMNIGDVTVRFSSEAEVHEFMALARQITTQGPSPEQIAQLYWLPKLMTLASESAVRKYEQQLGGNRQPAQPGQQAPGSTPPQQGQRPPVVPPAQDPPARTSNDPFGRVPSSRELHKQLDPTGFQQVQSGKKGLFEI